MNPKLTHAESDDQTSQGETDQVGCAGKPTTVLARKLQHMTESGNRELKVHKLKIRLYSIWWWLSYWVAVGPLRVNMLVSLKCVPF